MPKTKDGQGYSEATPYKQEGFAKVLAKISNIAFYAQKKQCQKEFIYIDCNAGCGVDDSAGKGSPVIAMDVLGGQSLVGKTQRGNFDNLIFIFCDCNDENIKKLKALCIEKYKHLKTYCFCGNNNSIEFFDFVESIVNDSIKTPQPFGLIYSDPNGSIDYPLDNINRFAKSFRLQRTDILVNFNTVQMKRNRIVFKESSEHQRRHLIDVVSAINKKKQFVRRYYPKNNCFKFAHFLFTNYAKMGEYKGISMFDVNSKEGKALFTELCFTKKELEQLNSFCECQLDLFA